MKVISIVVTYNGEKWIRKCLDSISLSNVKTQIIVIDNNSNDKTVSIIENEYKNILLIKSEENLGFGKGNNIGLRNAIEEDADYVFLLNQDAYIKKNTIEKLIEVHENNSQFGILSPFHLNYEGTEIEDYFSRIIHPELCPGLTNDIYFKQLKTAYEINFIHAAAWLMSKTCLAKVGGFDPIFPHYSEDNDYINRALYYGFEIGVVPQSKVYHKGSNDALHKFDYNLQIHLNFIILKLKDVRYKLPALILVHLKTSFDKVTSAILYRRGKDFIFQNKLFWKSIFILPKIMKSRKKVKELSAFIKNN